MTENKISESEYHVAISFLQRDLALAEQLRDKLEPSLHTFVYSREQEEIALDDGMDRFRTVFKDGAKISLVLHRAQWGHTPWTGIEESAIRDRCLHTKFRSLAIVKLDDSPLPEWVPETHIAFDSTQYPIEELVGAIKRKAQVDFRLPIGPISAKEEALHRMQDAAYHQSTLELFKTREGAEAVRHSVVEIFQQFCEKVAEFNNPTLQWRPDSGFNQQEAVAQLGYGSVQILYLAPYANRVDNLRIRLFEALLPIPGRNQMAFGLEGKEVNNVELHATRTPCLGICWSLRQTDNPMTAEQVAEFAVSELVALADRLRRERLG